MLAPDAVPLEPEPGRECRGLRALHLRLQCWRTDPTPGADLGGIDLHAVVAATDEHRAQLVLGGGRVELCLVLEFEQKMQWAGQAQLLLQPAVNGGLHALGTPRVAAAAVGPV